MPLLCRSGNAARGLPHGPLAQRLASDFPPLSLGPTANCAGLPLADGAWPIVFGRPFGAIRVPCGL